MNTRHGDERSLSRDGAGASRRGTAVRWLRRRQVVGQVPDRPLSSRSRDDDTAAVGSVVAFIVTCRAGRKQVLAGKRIDDEVECALRDHVMIAHRDVLQPDTRSELLQLFHVVSTLPPD